MLLCFGTSGSCPHMSVLSSMKTSFLDAHTEKIKHLSGCNIVQATIMTLLYILKSKIMQHISRGVRTAFGTHHELVIYLKLKFSTNRNQNDKNLCILRRHSCLSKLMSNHVFPLMALMPCCGPSGFAPKIMTTLACYWEAQTAVRPSHAAFQLKCPLTVFEQFDWKC